MLTSNQIRQAFLDFFESKQHSIVDSAPVVLKDDPTLMFTNAGMNQFKDVFLGNKTYHSNRVADTQKCLRVSGKHNDLEEVGVDTYHHTMFEMLGNWSFGDYFKKDAIDFAWELLTKIYNIDQDRLYITVFEGDESDGLKPDNEAVEYWEKWIPKDRILYFDRKDNFWEMGETGPCGPSSEVHVDMRDESERILKPGHELVNKDHPEVIEIWNLVFIQFNRKSNGSLEDLPATHVDTGMGFERLSMVLQGKSSSYDSDIFEPTIAEVEKQTGKKYNVAIETDIAIRVVVDHIRAITFTIADGQIPSNTGAGYVIRRILRRAVRYYYNFLDRKEPILYLLVEILAKQFEDIFPEVNKQVDFITKVIQEEEKNFLKTLEGGLKRLDNLIAAGNSDILSGDAVFELYDTYGFPVDLTRLIASEKDLIIDEKGFEKALKVQKERSRAASSKESGDWVLVSEGESKFVGYDTLVSETKILKYRHVAEKKHQFTQIVLQETPFYAESGGQSGDKGVISTEDATYKVFNTKRENELIIHNIEGTHEVKHKEATASIHSVNRTLSCKNHSATHLMHAALKKVLGDHVQQKGSFLNAHHLRFDFSHFTKMSEEEIKSVEHIVNERIYEDIPLDEQRGVNKDRALEMGATALFGEKYGDQVRVITFGPEYSVELCGGTHVQSTGEIGLFKIIHETAVAAGVRRIEAITSQKAFQYLSEKEDTLKAISSELNHPKEPIKAVQSILEENNQLKKKLELFEEASWQNIKTDLKSKIVETNGVNLILQNVGDLSADGLKKISFELRNEVKNLIALIGSNNNGKALLGLLISNDLVASKDLNAGTLIRDFAKHIQGGGGGQPFYATAGGKSIDGINKAIEAAKTYFTNSLAN